MPPQVPAQDPLIGLEFGHYRIESKVGSGGMGVVYLARDSHLDRHVAIKLLHPGTIADDSARHRFHNEARALSKLNHPNIATIHDFDSQGGTDFLVMEFIPGKPLSNRLATGPLPESALLPLALQLTEGLIAAHDHAIIHRDLKPANLVLTDDGRLKILDFGLARLRVPLAESVTQSELETHSLAGTFPYMAPEQLLGGDLDARTDLYSTGLILYEMATGQRPFSELPSSKIFDAILHRAPLPPHQLNPKLSSELETIITKCLEKDPARRYQSARELAVDLRRLQRDSSADTLVFDRPRGTPIRSLLRNKLFLASLAALFLLAILATTFFLLGARNPLRALFLGSSRIQSIAVLPLANLSGDPEREFFADGVTEELITQLGKSTNLRVISRQSVMQFKHTSLPLSEIARKLDVDAVVEGSVLQSGNRVRVTARLVPASTEKPVWSEQYDRDLRDVLTLQAEVTQAIAGEIKLKLSPEESARLSVSRPVNPEAYEAYLKGRFFWYQISKTSNEEAGRYFQLALEKDPNNALAYSGLADVWLMRTDSGYALPSEVLEKAKAYALKAVKLDPSLAEPYVSLANITIDLDHDWAAGERFFQRAIQANPSSAIAHFMYADALICRHRVADWEIEIQRTLALDPLYFFWRTFYGWQLTYLGGYDEAIQVLQAALVSKPDFSSAHLGLWVAYFKKNMNNEAFASAVHFFEDLNDRETVNALHSGFAAGGYREAMKRGGDVLAARAQHSHVSAVRIARLYAHAGENDVALTWLEKAVSANETPTTHLAVARDWDALRPDPRFQVLLRRLNLPQ
ncbi:MAG TPA: protein kinase [Candidatus Limnocylindrales bacterium]|nr:protein kinase [Candidatus Limnocylindrales bacterium]